MLTFDLGIEAVDIRDQRVVLLLLGVLPLVTGVLVDQVAQGFGEGGTLFAQGLDVHEAISRYKKAAGETRAARVVRMKQGAVTRAEKSQAVRSITATRRHRSCSAITGDA
ncbi:hypothetical protein D9M69_518170 [compost metagenome]